MGIFINPNAIQDNSMAKDKLNTSLQTEIDNKQEALTLTVKDNGNIILANIQGQSKEFMPATPSGDPMHYAYVAAGAEYNDTGADIIKTTPWADLADDDADKTVVHKAGYWYLNGLGDITNDEIRKIYRLSSNFPPSPNLQGYFRLVRIKTNFSANIRSGWTPYDLSGLCDGANIPILNLTDLAVSSIKTNVSTLNNVVCILGNIMPGGVLTGSNTLMFVKINKLKNNASLQYSSKLSIKSVLYMINKEAATSPITITLHADVYNRCMANADILAALEAHPNISLASA